MAITKKGTGSSGQANPGQAQSASLAPDSFVQGGLLDDVDVKVTSVRFVLWDYNGAIENPQLFLLAKLVYDDNGTEATQEQYYSAGDPKRFEPSEDGKRAIRVGSAQGLSSSTNAAQFFKSLADQGFPMDKLAAGDVSVIDGMIAHVNRVAQPKRSGIKDRKQKEFEDTVLVVTKIIKMPWETKGAANAGKAATGAVAGKRTIAPVTTAPASPSNGSGDLNEEAQGILYTVLGENGKSVPRTKVAQKAFKHLAGNPNRSAILQLFTSDEFLSAEGQPWEFDGETITTE